MFVALLGLFACLSPPVPPCEIFIGYLDQDGDGFGDEAFEDCSPPENLVDVGGDCDDADPRYNPGAIEVCDGRDLNCDGSAEELNWWPDLDQDGFGAGELVYGCSQPAAHAAQDGDCDDADPSAWPGAEEIWYDGVDQDCMGGNDWDQDGDLTEYPSDCDDTEPQVFPGAPELCQNGVDDDCNGAVDDCQFFGGVAPAFAELRVAGLAPSAFGEHQFTGVGVDYVGDLDADGRGEFGLCGDTEYFGGYHIFLSTESESALLDLKDASVHLDWSCSQGRLRTGALQDPREGSTVLFEFGEELYRPADWGGLGWEPTLVIADLAGSQKAVVDVASDGTQDLLFRLTHSTDVITPVEPTRTRP